jgi:hypothetical protein
MHPAGLHIEALLGDCRIRRQRRSGPGGQHRNKVETAVVVRHLPTGIEGEATERRSQEQNRQRAIFRLRVNLAVEVRRGLVSESPSDLWRQRCSSGRIHVRVQHHDFPALLAEAMDMLAAHGGDVAAAASQLASSASQLVKFLKLEPRALRWLNDQRADQGLRPLK